MKRVLLTGGTGFLGTQVISSKPSGYAVELFARETSDLSAVPVGIRVHRGDLSAPESLERALRGVDVLINLASLGFGHADGIVAACRAARVPRVVFIGTTAVFTTLPATSKAVRLAAERSIQQSGLDFTLLRPTMIYGTPRDRNIWRLIHLLRWAPAIPLVNGGVRLQQPVHVEDVAGAAWAVIDRPGTSGQAYNIGGREPLRMADMVSVIGELLGRRITVIPVPLRMALAGAALARMIPGAPVLTREQILRLEEDKAFDNGPATRAFGFEPMSFRDGVAKELNWIR